MKEGTARIAVYRELNIPNIFTMEASFCGADQGEYQDSHFTTEAYMKAGQKLLEAMIVYFNVQIKGQIKEGEPESPLIKFSAKELE